MFQLGCKLFVYILLRCKHFQKSNIMGKCNITLYVGSFTLLVMYYVSFHIKFDLHYIRIVQDDYRKFLHDTFIDKIEPNTM